jgi:predicted transcriptional regulator
MATPHTIFLPIKVSPQIRDKLDALAKSVHKSRSATIRALILAADVTDLPSCWRDIPEAERALVRHAEGRPA